MSRGIYWKKEASDRRWKFIHDTDASREQAIAQGAMFFTTMALSEEYKDNGQPEPTRCGDLVLDFDSADPAVALKDMKDLCLFHLPELYDIDPQEIKFFCSGGKGFHAVLSCSLFGAEAGDPYLPLIYKEIVGDWVERFELSTVDLSMYAMRRGKMFRIENVKRANGKYKVPLFMEEVRDMGIENILKLSEGIRYV